MFIFALATGFTGRCVGGPFGGAVKPLPAGTMRAWPPPRGLKETVDSVTSSDMPRFGEKPIPNCVPRIPAVPTGLEISKFDFLFSFLVLTTRSPTSKSTNTLDELGSSFRSPTESPLSSKGSCTKEEIFIFVFSLTVTTVPLLSSSRTFPPGPVCTLAPSGNRAPGMVELFPKG